MAKNTKTKEGKNDEGGYDVLTSIVMMNTNLGEHGIILDLRFPQGRTVVGNDNQLTYTWNGIIMSETSYSNSKNRIKP